jgi:hypothetical protein
VNKVMRIECNVNIIKLVFKTPDQCRQARHIMLRSRHIQSPSPGIAKVHLGINDQQFNSLTHNVGSFKLS